MNQKTCSKCDRPHSCKGLCTIHYSREYRATHKEEIHTYKVTYQSEHPEKARQHSATYAAKNPEKIRAANKRNYTTERNNTKHEKRRAQKMGAAICETVKRSVVAERDGWICQLCFQPIDPSLTYINPETGRPDPGYLNVDHRIPLAKGGDHSYANCQAAHARCNASKKDSLMVTHVPKESLV